MSASLGVRDSVGAGHGTHLQVFERVAGGGGSGSSGGTHTHTHTTPSQVHVEKVGDHAHQVVHFRRAQQARLQVAWDDRVVLELARGHQWWGGEDDKEELLDRSVLSLFLSVSLPYPIAHITE